MQAGNACSTRTDFYTYVQHEEFYVLQLLPNQSIEVYELGKLGLRRTNIFNAKKEEGNDSLNSRRCPAGNLPK